MKIYFAGKYHKSEDKKQLLWDYRLNLHCGEEYEMVGAFYSAEVYDKSYGSEIAKEIINRQINQIRESDLVVVVLEKEISTGTILEMQSAMKFCKRIIVFYTKESLEEYWYLINHPYYYNRLVMVEYDNYHTVTQLVNHHVHRQVLKMKETAYYKAKYRLGGPYVSQEQS